MITFSNTKKNTEMVQTIQTFFNVTCSGFRSKSSLKQMAVDLVVCFVVGDCLFGFLFGLVYVVVVCL